MLRFLRDPEFKNTNPIRWSNRAENVAAKEQIVSRYPSSVGTLILDDVSFLFQHPLRLCVDFGGNTF
jgi:hypothetical protein